MDLETFCRDSFNQLSEERKFIRKCRRSYVSYDGEIQYIEEQMNIWQNILQCCDASAAIEEIQKTIDQLWNLAEEDQIGLEVIDTDFFRCKLSALRNVQSMLVSYHKQQESSSKICYWTDEC